MGSGGNVGAIWLGVWGLDAQILCGCPWKGFGGLFGPLGPSLSEFAHGDLLGHGAL